MTQPCLNSLAMQGNLFKCLTFNGTFTHLNESRSACIILNSVCSGVGMAMSRWLRGGRCNNVWVGRTGNRFALMGYQLTLGIRLQMVSVQWIRFTYRDFVYRMTSPARDVTALRHTQSRHASFLYFILSTVWDRNDIITAWQFMFTTYGKSISGDLY